ncbi:MAG: YggT family protein [Caldilineaceae bacterium]|nr:YggT family protein [Caldilineaceae bacterium]
MDDDFCRTFLHVEREEVSVLSNLVAGLIEIYIFVLLARILVTWIPNLDPSNPIIQMLFQITDPVLEPARKLIPPIGMIDISPIIVFIALQFIAGIVRQLPF